MSNLGIFLVQEVALAITKRCAVATVRTGGEEYTFINLPTPQQTGTDMQKKTYAVESAKRLVAEKGIKF